MHPQEQQLQKFKKEFEAWHSSRTWENSRGCGLDSRDGPPNDYQALAQERLNREKLTRYADAKRNETNEKPSEIGHHVSSRAGTEVQGDDFLEGNNNSKVLQTKKLESMPIQHVDRNSHCDQAFFKRCDEQEIRSLPARIVLLKPGPERFDDLDKSDSASEVKSQEDEGSISDFLDQVKERLILGMTRTAGEDVERPNTGTNISCFDKSLSPKEVAQQTAMKERDRVMRDTGFIQSESSKSLGSDVQAAEGSIECFLEEVKERLILVMRGNEEKDLKRPGRQIKSSHFDGSISKDISQQTAKQLGGNVASNRSPLQSKSMLSQSRNVQNRMPGSPKFSNRDTQRLLSEASHPGILETEEAGKRNSIYNKGEISSVPSLSGTRKTVNHQNERQHTAELAATSFPDDLKSKMVFDHDVVSSGSPAETTLAPICGTALRDLPTEDQPILASAYINRNHETDNNRASETRKRKKHRFSLKWKASNLKDSLSFRNKLFGKKIQSAKRGVDEFGLTSSPVTFPSVSRNLNMLARISTELFRLCLESICIHVLTFSS
ncbi:uncharacterized protein LOC116253216 [Nymphaea colorata]|uniref:uncharacterized protein LOC116253216 n=1 Tax=Nymphaea colorata TaxID=210225 RepID=UPI00214EC29C|nr:uncharacterized protein LOC116253216 [Nymphaea colorata]